PQPEAASPRTPTPVPDPAVDSPHRAECPIVVSRTWVVVEVELKAPRTTSPSAPAWTGIGRPRALAAAPVAAPTAARITALRRRREVGASGMAASSGWPRPRDPTPAPASAWGRR